MSRDTSRGLAPVAAVCEAFGISRQGYYAAQRPRAADAPQKRRVPRAGSWVSDCELLRQIRRVLMRFPGWGVRKVWAFLRRQGTRAGRERIWKIMQAQGLTLPPLGERPDPERRGHVSVPESNRRWATDLTTTWTAKDGTVALVPVIDCGDRFVFEIEVTKSQEAPAVLAPLERALHQCFGRPEAIPPGLELRSDHGPQYTGSDCESLCAHWKLEHTFAPVARPTGNAVAERFIQTLKIELLWTRDWDSIDELRAAVCEWLRSYNYERPHQALADRTPAEKRESLLGREQFAA